MIYGENGCQSILFHFTMPFMIIFGSWTSIQNCQSYLDAHCKDVRFVSFLSAGFITAIVVFSPDKKLAKHTSVHCSTLGANGRLCSFSLVLVFRKVGVYIQKTWWELNINRIPEEFCNIFWDYWKILCLLLLSSGLVLCCCL